MPSVEGLQVISGPQHCQEVAQDGFTLGGLVSDCCAEYREKAAYLGSIRDLLPCLLIFLHGNRDTMLTADLNTA